MLTKEQAESGMAADIDESDFWTEEDMRDATAASLRYADEQMDDSFYITEASSQQDASSVSIQTFHTQGSKEDGHLYS